MSLSTSVIIATHQRPVELVRCLDAVLLQLGPADQVIVVHRPEDSATTDALRAYHGRISTAPVLEPGVWPAYRTGVATATGDLVAFLDDDAIPMPGWLLALAEHFTDASVGAAGGPILNFHGVRCSNGFITDVPIAKATRFGRLQSHLHELPAWHRVEDVDFLPGSNLAIRRALLALDEYELPGMAPAIEWRMCLRVRSHGLKIRYDSEIRVEHHPAPRSLDRDDRGRIAFDLGFAMVAIAKRELTGSRRWFTLIYWLVVGTRSSLGLAFAPYCAIKRGESFYRFRRAAAGRRAALT